MLPQPKYPTFGYNIFNLLSCEINWLIEVRVWSEVPLNGTCSGWRGKSTNNRIFALILGQNEPSVQIMAQGFSLLRICGREKLTYPSLSLFNQDFSNNANKHVHSYLNKLHIGILMVLENSAYKFWSQKFLFYYSSMENKIQLIWWHVLYFVFSLHYWFMLSCKMLLF